MALGNTVYDRLKKTGFMMGPQHAMGASFDMKANPDKQDPTMMDDDSGTPEKPPALRDSIDTSECCGTCANFDPGGGEDMKPCCEKYNDYPVTANQVCDSYEDKQPESAKEMLNSPEGSASNMPATVYPGA